MIYFSQIFTAFCVLAIGLYSFIKNRYSVINISFFLMCLFGSGWVMAGAWVEILSQLRINPLIASRISMMFASLMAGSILVFSLCFPKNRIKFYQLLIVYAISVLSSLFALAGFYIKEIVFINGYVRIFSKMAYLLFFIIVFFLSLSILNLLINYITSKGKAKVQVLYILVGIMSGFFVAILFSFILPLLGNNKFFFLGYFGPLLFFFSVAYAITKHRLMDIRIFIRKGTIYTIVVGLFTGIYLAILFLIGQIFQKLARPYTVAIVIPVLLIFAVLFQPIKNRVQNIIDKLFFKERLNYQKLLKDLSCTSTSVVDLDILLNTTLKIMVDQLYIDRASLYLSDNKVFVPKASCLHDNKNKSKKR